MQQLVENGEDITIVGIVQPDYTASASMLTSGIAYPASLTEKVMEDAADSDIVKQQMADPATNVLTGESFGKAESLRDFDFDQPLLHRHQRPQECLLCLMPLPSTST